MRNITRSNYTPKTGDYHNMIVHDPVKGKIWLFDCDGTYLDMSKTNVVVVNEGGESEEYAISQAYVTNRFAALTSTITEVDENAHNRDDELNTLITTKEGELITRINTVNSDAIARENQMARTINAHVDRLDNDIEHLTDVADNLTSLVNTINSTAVFDVTLEQGVNITLKVTDGSQLTNTVIREASASQNGLMPAAAFAQVNSNTQAIESLQNAGLYRGSFTTLQDAPTTTPDSAFIGGEIYQNDFITVQQASEGGQTGIARYRAAVNNGAVSYAFETFIDKDIPNFSAGNAGLIVGSTTDGEVEATQSGTGAVKGWSTVKNDIAANAQNITTNANAISALDGRLTTAEGNITSLGGRVTTNENAITALDGRVTAVESTTTSQGADITALKNKSVQATTDTTLSANSEKLLTVKGMLRQWVDITQDGLPVDPDPDTFYYTVES